MLRFLYAALQRICVCLLSLSLCITPEIGWAANVLLFTNLKHIESDLGNATLIVDGIDSNLRLQVTPTGILTVSHFEARQVILKFKDHLPLTNDSNSQLGTLPDHIHIPLPFQLLSGHISQLTIEQAHSAYQIHDIQFDLNANSQKVQFNIMHADSPWGQIQTAFTLQNAAPFKLQGRLELSQPNAKYPYHLRTDLAGDLNHLEIDAQHHLQAKDNTYTISPAYNESEDIVRLHASIHLDALRSSHLSFQIIALNNQYIHPQLAGRLNLNVEAEGSLAEQGRMTVQMRADHTTIQNYPLQLHGSAALENLTLSDLELHAQLDQNTLAVETHKNSATPFSLNYRWEASLVNLSQLMPGFSGAIKGNGEIKQDNLHFSANYQLSGNQLNLPNGTALDQIEAKGALSDDEQAQQMQTIRILGLTQQNQNGENSPPINADLTLSGTLLQHQAALHIQDSDSTLGRTMQIGLSGRWQARQWQAVLNRLEDDDAKIFKLDHAAKIQWQAEKGLDIADVNLHVMGGSVLIQQIGFKPANDQNHQTQDDSTHGLGFTSVGKLNAFPVQAFLNWYHPQAVSALPEGHLRINADWQFNINQTFNGQLNIRHDQGDWLLYDVLSGEWHPMGIRHLDTHVIATNNHLSFNTLLSANEAGEIKLNLQTDVHLEANQLIIKNSTPLALSLHGQLTHLEWLQHVLPDIQAHGQFLMNIAGGGTWGHPLFSGNFSGKQVSIAIPAQGVWLGNGAVDLLFAGDQAQFKQLSFEGKSGKIDGAGNIQLNWPDWEISLALKINQLMALSKVERWLIMSGSATLKATPKTSELAGEIKIHKGLFTLPKSDKPQLDEDIVIQSDQVDVLPKNSTLNFKDVSFDFGGKPSLPLNESELFIVRGQGLDSALSGKIKLNGTLTQLAAYGSLDVTGTYSTYGQTLNIETGRLAFSGKLPNIGVNISATRQVGATKVGIQVTGSVQKPELQLVSTPDTTNENKISMLVLGQPISSVGSNDMTMLSMAAGAILSQEDSVPLQTKLARGIGLDNINVSGNSATNYTLSAGKKLNKNLTVGYEKSIAGLLNVGKLTYQLTNRVSIETRTGSDNAMDIFYGFSFN